MAGDIADVNGPGGGDNICDIQLTQLFKVIENITQLGRELSFFPLPSAPNEPDGQPYALLLDRSWRNLASLKSYSNQVGTMKPE